MVDETMKSTFREIPVSAIIVADRLRETDPAWVEVLAGMIAETRLLHPIEVIAEGDNYRMVAGAHRLAAINHLGRENIEARVLDAGSVTEAAMLRLHEIYENLGQSELKAFDRAVHLAAWKEVHEELYPASKRGGDRRSKAAKNQNENFSFCSDAAQKVGLGKRSIEKIVSLFDRLSPESRTRIPGSPLADHQSELNALSELPAEDQTGVLDLLLADEPKASRVAEAHDLLCNIKRPTEDPADKAIKQLISIYTLAPAKAKKHFRRWLEDDA